MSHRRAHHTTTTTAPPSGFIPRTYARMVMREGLDVALKAAKSKGFLAGQERCEGTDAHYSYFESLLTGRDLFDAHSAVPTDQVRGVWCVVYC